MPECPGPEDLPDDSQRWDKIREQLNPTAKARSAKHGPRLLPIQMRSVEPIDYINPVARKAEQFVWIKTAGELPAEQDTGLHNAILAYASDFSLMSTALMPHEVSIMNPNLQPASLIMRFGFTIALGWMNGFCIIWIAYVLVAVED